MNNNNANKLVLEFANKMRLYRSSKRLSYQKYRKLREALTIFKIQSKTKRMSLAQSSGIIGNPVECKNHEPLTTLA